MFGTSGVRGTVGEEVTATLALSIGRALATEGYDRVVVGRDARESGRFLGDALTAGLRECGADAIDVGMAATPTVARSVARLGADAGVVITASHNPQTDNGIKLWLPSGKAFGPSDQDAIVERVESEEYDLALWNEVGDLTERGDATETHAAALREAISIPAGAEPDVVADLGNGAGGVTADVLYDLGCGVRTLNAQPDGRFPGRPSEPNRETLDALMALVEGTDADLGIAHDGDADRMMAVDETGEFVPKDVLLALFAREAAGEGDRVAVPVDTSLAVEDAVAAVGASLIRTRVGDVYVADRATEPDVVFGGEPSGAWIWPDQTLCPDGPLAACRLAELVAARGPLSELVAEIDTYPIRRESIRVEEKAAVVERIETRVLAEYPDAETLDGVRVETDDGWFLLRASGTESLIRVTAEARDETRADALAAEASGIVRDARND